MSTLKALGITIIIFVILFVSIASMYFIYILTIFCIFAGLVYTIKYVLDSHP